MYSFVLNLYIRESCFLTQKCFIKKILSILVSMFLIYYNWESEKVHYFFSFLCLFVNWCLIKTAIFILLFLYEIVKINKSKKKKKKAHKEKHLNVLVKRFSEKSSDWSSLFQHRIWLFSFVCTSSLSLFKASPHPYSPHHHPNPTFIPYHMTGTFTAINLCFLPFQQLWFTPTYLTICCCFYSVFFFLPSKSV